MNKGVLTALCGAATIALLGFTPQDEGVLLRRDLTKVGTDNYRMDMKVAQTIQLGSMGMGDMPIDISSAMKLGFKVGDQDPETKKSPVDITMSDIKFDLQGIPGGGGGMGGGMPEMPKEIKSKAKIDERNRFTDIQNIPIPGQNPQMGQMMMMMGGSSNPLTGFLIEFPEKAVKFGETWDVKMPKNPMLGNQEIVLKATLVGEKEFMGEKAYEISMTGSFPLKVDFAEMMKNNPEMQGMMGGMNMQMSGKMEMRSVYLVQKGTGKTLSMESLTKSSQRLDLPDMGQGFDMSGETTIKIVIEK